MIIDFHTHTFPEAIATKAVSSLAERSHIINNTDGRNNSLIASMRKAGVDYSVLLPVATKPSQCASINRVAIELNNTSSATGLLSFGGIHPLSNDYKDILRSLAKSGIKGIKLHPVYQNSNVDGLETLRIIDEAYNNNLIVLIHSGYDIGFPGNDAASVTRLHSMITTLPTPPKALILAHMGGWKMWDEVLLKICGLKNVYLDTAFSITDTEDEKFMSLEAFCNMVNHHGADKILYGSDSPWTDQATTISMIRKCNLPQESIENILGNNAQRLLGL